MVEGVMIVKLFKKLEFILSIRIIYYQIDQSYPNPQCGCQGNYGETYASRKDIQNSENVFFEQKRTKFPSKKLRDINIYMFSVMSVSFNNVIRGVPWNNFFCNLYINVLYVHYTS